MSTILIFILLLIALLSVGFIGMMQWREHRAREVAAQTRGWRYRYGGWYAFWESQYAIVGSTATGIIWQLTRVKSGQQLYFRWTTENATLEHGSLQIRPQKKLGQHPLPKNLQKHLITNIGNKSWQKEYAVLTTHKFSTKKYINPELEQAMITWPKWPDPGALEELNWQENLLQIDGRYHNDWNTIERMVALGVLLTANHINAPLVKK